MYEHINYPNKSDVNFWWNVEGDYFVFFGEDKKKIIEYFRIVIKGMVKKKK